MAKYVTTRKAGKYVAGQENKGPGSVLELSGKQAEYEVALGTIVPAPEEPEKTGKGSDDDGKKTRSHHRSKKPEDKPEDKAEGDAKDDGKDAGDADKAD